MSRQKRYQDKIVADSIDKFIHHLHDRFPERDVRELNAIKRAMNYKAISKTADLYRKEGKSNEEISNKISSEIGKELETGKYDKYLTTGPARMVLRKLIQPGELKTPANALYYLTHPVQAMGAGLKRSLFGYLPDFVSEQSERLGGFVSYLGDLVENKEIRLPEPVTKLIKYMGDLMSAAKITDALERFGFIGTWGAKSRRHRIKKELKYTKRELTKFKPKKPKDLERRVEVAAATAVVLLFLVGVSLIGYSLFKPNITGYVVLESGQSVSLGLIFGIAFIIVAFGFLYVRRILKNKK